MEARLFEPGTIPDWTTPGWYAGRETAPHLEQEGHHERLIASAHFAQQALSPVGGGCTSAVDLGAGDGGLLSILPDDIEKWGYDLQQTNVDVAKVRGVQVSLRDVIEDGFLVADLVIVTEMLEHLIDPHLLVKQIWDSGAQAVVASSPYTETAESHYGYHTWAWDEEGYQKMFTDVGFKIVATGRAWISQIVLLGR